MVGSPNEKIRYLLQQRFKAQISSVDMLGQFDLREKNPLLKLGIEKEIEEYCKELETQSPEGLKALYKAAHKKELDDKKNWEEQLEQETKEYINENGMQARYSYWAKMAHWSAEEAIALTLEFDPLLMSERTTPRDIKIFIAHKIRQLREIIERALYMEQLDEPITPPGFLRWVKRCNIDFPKELEALIALPESKMAKPQEKSFGTRERETLLKLIIGMAIKGYGYNPRAARNEAIKEIVNDLIELDIPIGDDTLREKLRDATELLSQEVEKA